MSDSAIVRAAARDIGRLADTPLAGGASSLLPASGSVTGAQGTGFETLMRMLVAGAPGMHIYELIGMILLIVAAVNWMVVMINYNIYDVKAGEMGGVVPDLVADMFKLDPKDPLGTADAGAANACKIIQAILYSLVGLGVIGALIYMLRRSSTASGVGPVGKLCAALLLIGGLNWIVTLIMMYLQPGQSAGLAPDLVFALGEAFGGSQVVLDSDDNFKTIQVTQSIVYCAGFLAVILMIYLKASKSRFMTK